MILAIIFAYVALTVANVVTDWALPNDASFWLKAAVMVPVSAAIWAAFYWIWGKAQKTPADEAQ